MCRVATVPGARIPEPTLPSSNVYELIFLLVLFLFRLVQVQRQSNAAGGNFSQPCSLLSKLSYFLTNKKIFTNLSFSHPLWWFSHDFKPYWSRHVWENREETTPKHMNTGCLLGLRPRSRLIIPPAKIRNQGLLSFIFNLSGKMEDTVDIVVEN